MERHLTSEQNGIQVAAERQIGPSLTQLRSPPVHPFSSQIHALDCKLRAETDQSERFFLTHDIWLLREGLTGRNGKRFIGRQIAVRSGTYKPPEARWLKRALPLDAVREAD